MIIENFMNREYKTEHNTRAESKKQEEYVILVNENNRKIGLEEKVKAHKEGLLHRAFSIFVFNDKEQLLIQQRAIEKYHSGGIWANTVCSHPRPNENYKEATHRRLVEEMGFDCSLKKKFSFIYRVKFENGLTEHEHDTVFTGVYNKDPKPNPKEVMDYKWISIEDLQKDIYRKPYNYSAWLKIALKEMK